MATLNGFIHWFFEKLGGSGLVYGVQLSFSKTNKINNRKIPKIIPPPPRK